MKATNWEIGVDGTTVYVRKGNGDEWHLSCDEVRARFNTLSTQPQLLRPGMTVVGTKRDVKRAAPVLAAERDEYLRAVDVARGIESGWRNGPPFFEGRER